MNAHNTLTAPALVRAVQCAMVNHLDGAEAVIDATKPMQRAAYLQGCAALHAAALQAAATTHAAETIAAALDRLAAARLAHLKAKRRPLLAFRQGTGKSAVEVLFEWHGAPAAERSNHEGGAV